ncbi:MAG TPA: MraY family glycosyltransferase [bacterium]
MTTDLLGTALGFAFGTSALAALCVTPLVRRVAGALGVIDRPSPRKIHRRPVPRMGGLAVCAAWLLGITAASALAGDPALSRELWPPASLGCLVVMLTLLDDWRDLRGEFKLLIQVAVAAMVFAMDLRIDRISNPMGGQIILPPFASWAVTTVWVVGMMNALNLIDGLDGLAAGISGIAAFGLMAAGLQLEVTTSAVMLAALSGACLGFLRHNFHPASIFLGDSGSQFLGYLFAVVPLVDHQYKAATAVTLLVPLTALTIPVYDTFLAAYRRMRGRRSVFSADKFHLHHRLLRMGLTQRQAALFMYLVSAYLCGLAVVFVLIPERYALILLVLLGMGLAMGMQTLRFLEFAVHRRARRGRRRRE